VPSIWRHYTTSLGESLEKRIRPFHAGQTRLGGLAGKKCLLNRNLVLPHPGKRRRTHLPHPQHTMSQDAPLDQVAVVPLTIPSSCQPRIRTRYTWSPTKHSKRPCDSSKITLPSQEYANRLIGSFGTGAFIAQMLDVLRAPVRNAAATCARRSDRRAMQRRYT
jgi:hypothetical protein